MKKIFTSSAYVEWLNKQAVLHRPFWYAASCFRCTTQLLDKLKAAYCAFYADKFCKYAQKDIIEGQICSDSIGAIKGAVWTDLGAHDAVPGLHGLMDVSLAAFRMLCAERYGVRPMPIDTLPERPGVALLNDRLIGVYVGGGHVVYWSREKGGCAKSRVIDGAWQEWMDLPWVDYGETTDAPACLECSPFTTLGTRTLTEGTTGDDVLQLCLALSKVGLSPKRDSVECTPKIMRLVAAFQTRFGLVPDGEYGPKTHMAMMRELGMIDDERSASDDGVISAGRVVRVTGTTYYSGVSIQPWVLGKTWRIYSVDDDKVTLGESEDGKFKLMVAVKIGDVEAV